MGKNAPERDGKHTTLGLASRHALDATRVDDQGRKALHRFSASYNVAPEHLKRVRGAASLRFSFGGSTPF